LLHSIISDWKSIVDNWKERPRWFGDFDNFSERLEKFIDRHPAWERLFVWIAERLENFVEKKEVKWQERLQTLLDNWTIWGERHPAWVNTLETIIGKLEEMKEEGWVPRWIRRLEKIVETIQGWYGEKKEKVLIEGGKEGGHEIQTIIPGNRNVLEQPPAETTTNGITTTASGQHYITIDGRRRLLPSYASGTDYIPNAGLAYLHRGEAVIPAGENSGRQFNGNVNITVHANVANNVDIKYLAKELGYLFEAQLRTM